MENTKNVKFLVTGMTCASCVRTIEKSLSKMKGIEKVSVNLMTEEAEVTYDEEQVQIDSIIKKFDQIGYSGQLKSDSLSSAVITDL
ncbi:MAG: cation transporter, partial [Candidatus Heimdallarchaeota archaeon]